MKRSFLIAAAAIVVISSNASAYDISRSQVPSVILNNFQKTFPKTYDVEWELEAGLYKVEFETSYFGRDHEAWYDRSGKLVEHKQEISQSDLPVQIRTTLKKELGNYRVDEAEKVVKDKTTNYIVELKRFSEELKVVLSSNGIIISKTAS